MYYEPKTKRVVDANGIYKTIVLLFLMPTYSIPEGWTPESNIPIPEPVMEWVVQDYTLEDGDRLVDAPPVPQGMVKARWTGTDWEEAATPEEIEAADTRTVEEVRREVLCTLSSASYAAIVAGCDAALSDGTAARFSLQETDQINLTAAVAAVEQGAVGYPYHADGALCRLFPAADILAIAQAATVHKLYHTTYVNHLNMWARRGSTKAKLKGITYGAELPADLAANMEEVLTSAAVV